MKRSQASLQRSVAAGNMAMGFLAMAWPLVLVWGANTYSLGIPSELGVSEKLHVTPTYAYSPVSNSCQSRQAYSQDSSPPISRGAGSLYSISSRGRGWASSALAGS